MEELSAKTKIAIPLGAIFGIIASLVVGMGWLNKHIDARVSAALSEDIEMKVYDLQAKVKQNTKDIEDLEE